MRARLARLFRVVADRLAGQSELDALRQRTRTLEVDLAHERKKFADEAAYVERLLREVDAFRHQATFWLRTAGDLSEAVIRQGAAAPRRPADVVAPVFGRRNRPPHLRPVE